MEQRSIELNAHDRAILRELEEIAAQYKAAGMTVPGRTLETIAVCRWRAGITGSEQYRAEIAAAREAHAAELDKQADEHKALAMRDAWRGELIPTGQTGCANH